MSLARKRPRILHIHSTFDPGGKEVRSARLINALGDEAEHAIVSGDLARRGAARLIGRHVGVSWPRFPALAGRPGLGRLQKIAAAMAGHDLICTYNWGAIDATMAHTLFADYYRLAPLVHHEDGFNEDEADRLKWRRNFYRRIALGRTAALVVPSRQLERIAIEVWQQPRSRVQRIANGIETARFNKAPKRDVLPGLIKRQGERWIGTLAGLRKVKQLDMLVRAMPSVEPGWQLVIAGEGDERPALEALIARLGLDDRVHLPGFVEHPEQIVGLFDVFALSSMSEQQPISVIEAMAAGLPVVAPRLGDIAEMVASENGPLLVEPGDEQGLARMLDHLARDGAARARIGAANRDKARREFDAAAMVARYRALYFGLMGQER